MRRVACAGKVTAIDGVEVLCCQVLGHEPSLSPAGVGQRPVRRYGSLPTWFSGNQLGVPDEHYLGSRRVEEQHAAHHFMHS